jgi:hypothetical protein
MARADLTSPSTPATQILQGKTALSEHIEQRY